MTVLVTASVLARAIYRDEPLTVLLIPAAVAAILAPPTPGAALLGGVRAKGVSLSCLGLVKRRVRDGDVYSASRDIILYSRVLVFELSGAKLQRSPL